MRLVLIAPPVAVALAKHPLVDQFDVSSLQVLMSGAAPLGGDVAAAVGARLGCTLMQGYGMTEMSPVSHISPVPGWKAGAVGVLLPDTEARIVDPATGADLGPEAEGELWVRGPQVMLGYHNAPAATASALADGWLRTGDLAVHDADGQFTIRDRLKELIKVSGFQVAPAEVEAELLAHPEIADAAVLGLPDEETGERVVAFIVPQPGTAPDAAGIAAFLADRLARFKRPAEVRLATSIPKSASGKILRRVLKAEALSG
jgi:4-coumarate--CoA ligase